MRMEPSKRRSVLDRTALGYRVTIPGRGRIVVAIFLLAWLGGWSMGGWSAAQQALQSWQKGQTEWFLLFWLLGWIVGELGVLTVLAYMAAGTEVITLRPGELSIRLAVAGLGWSREYDTAQVRNLRIAPPISGRQQWAGQVAFDYGASTIRFARDVDEAEAAFIIAEMSATALLPYAAA